MVKSNVRVLLRSRPRANPNAPDDCLSFHDDKKSVTVNPPAKPGVQPGSGAPSQGQNYTFHFDGVLHNASQEEVFDCCVPEVVDNALGGFNSTIMCYGQTGAGKTYTMTGGKQSFRARGIIPRAVSHLFAELKKMDNKKCKVQVRTGLGVARSQEMHEHQRAWRQFMMAPARLPTADAGLAPRTTQRAKCMDVPACVSRLLSAGVVAAHQQHPGDGVLGMQIWLLTQSPVYLPQVSYLEIYNDNMFDLLDITTQPHELLLQESRDGKVSRGAALTQCLCCAVFGLSQLVAAGKQGRKGECGRRCHRAVHVTVRL